MLTENEIRDKAARKYPQFLRSIVCDGKFFPLPIKFGKPKTTSHFEQLQTEFSALRKAEQSLGFSIKWIERTTTRWGKQTFPESVSFLDETSYLSAIDKTKEGVAFRANVALIRQSCPELEDWVRRFPHRIAVLPDEWSAILKVCHYFLSNPVPRMYPRQLPIGVHSKFIDWNHAILRDLLECLLGDKVDKQAEGFNARFHLLEPEPQIRFRFLDDAYRLACGFPIKDATVPLSQVNELNFKDCRCLIVENLMIFLTLPSLPRTIAIFGAGKAAALLPSVPWLRENTIFYWGDMDDVGFRILSGLRHAGLAVESIFMDDKTWIKFSELAHPGNVEAGSQDLHLEGSELSAWKKVREKKLMLEQELLPQGYIERELAVLFDLQRP
jgi:hypothetical protein